jgi:hypothetical protein
MIRKVSSVALTMGAVAIFFMNLVFADTTERNQSEAAAPATVQADDITNQASTPNHSQALQNQSQDVEGDTES